MIYGITYTDSNMTISAEKCRLSMMKNGCDDAAVFNDVDFEFKAFNKDIFQDGARGAGCYWLFKPYAIYRSMIYMNDGDVLIYSDAGVEFVNSVHEIINRMDEDIFFFTNGFLHVEWCKGDVIKTILPEFKYDGTERNIKQIQASVIFFRVSKESRDFVKEWLLFCEFPGFIDDAPSKESNYPTFAEHRHDQAILTCVAIKHGYTMDHWWPTFYSNHLPRTERDSYPVLFNHHRKRNNEF